MPLTPAPSVLAPSALAAGRPAAGARAWHAGWALGLATVAGLLLLLAREAPGASLLVGFALAIAPGAVGALMPGPRSPARLAVWTACAALATAAGGGLSGPLAATLAGPALAAVALGGASGGAAALSVAAVALVALLGLGRHVPDYVEAAPWLRAGVLVVVAAAAAYALAAPTFPLPPDAGEKGAGETDAGNADHKEAEEALRAELAQAHAARVAAERRAEGRARFIAQMSHELRTPLNAILGFSDIMRTRLFGPLPDRYAEYAQLIHESGGHLLELINDVLDLSRIEADRYELRLETFDAREAVNDAMRLVRGQAEEAGLPLRALLPTEPVEVEADRRAVKQMVLNLVSNALKFTPRGGGVDVIVRAAEGVLEIVVSDTGVGIAPEDLERLGRPYEQAAAGRATHGAAQGTGLGLSLVKAFAGLHGGELGLESRLGEGTAATVRLPVLRPREDGER